jgi:WD40 repeat protein
VATGRLLRSFEAHEGSTVQCLAFAPDGKTLACGGGGNQSKTLTLWDASTGRPLRSLAENVYTVHALAFSRDGSVLASGSGSLGNFGLPPGARNRAPEQGRSALRLWDVRTGKELKYLRGHKGAIQGLVFTADGAQVISGGSDGTIRCWDAANGKMLRTLLVTKSPYPLHSNDAESSGIRALALAPDGKILAAAGADGTVRTWDLASGKALKVLPGHEPATGAAFSPDGKTLATCGYDQVVRLWDPVQGTSLHTFPGHEGLVFKVAVSPRSDWIVSTGLDRTLRFWDLATGQERLVVRGLDHLNGALAVSPDGTLLASGGITGAVALWDTANGRSVRRLAGVQGEIRSAAFSPDGKLLAAATEVRGGGKEGRLYLWQVKSGRQLAQWESEHGYYCVRFSGDGRWLAAHAFLQGVAVWETASLEKQHSFADFIDFIDFAFLPDRKALAGWRKDGLVLVRDLASGQEVYRFQGPSRPNYVSHPIALSPDGRLLALPVGSDRDKKVQLWEMTTGKVRRTLEGHRGETLDYAFTADGQRVITASRDTTVLVWDLVRRSEAQIGPATGEQMQALWQELAQADAGRADRAIWRLAALPGQTIPFLQRRLRPVKDADPAQLARLAADLESEEFAVREAATKKLADLAEMAQPALQQALSGTPSLEARRRIEPLLARLKGPIVSAQPIQALRAVEVLEHIGTAEARRLLAQLAGGAEKARLTQTARASLARLTRP